MLVCCAILHTPWIFSTSVDNLKSLIYYQLVSMRYAIKYRVQQRVAGHGNFIEGFSVSEGDSLEVQSSLSFTPSKNAFNFDTRKKTFRIFSITKLNQIQKSLL